MKLKRTDRISSSKCAARIILQWLLTATFLISCKNNTDILQNTNSEPVKKFTLPDSGQTTSYTSTAGEDADFAVNPPSYTDNGNGTISDNITGLIWQKIDGGEMTFENALSYCDNLILAGINDWRLPNSVELYSINSFDKVNPALNTIYFTKTSAEYWWTNETRADAVSNVWAVNAGGGIGAHPRAETLSAGGTKRFHVRAVKGSALIIASDRFKDNGDGTISDNLTGLIWQKIQSSGTLTWEEALIYASGLSLAGKTDWRLPNIKELQSLNDVKLYKPSFNKNYFSNLTNGNFWSSTTLVQNPARAWDINIDYGIVSYNDKTLKEFALCVRQ